MIVVTVGSSQLPFDRLVRGLEGLPPGEELVVQRGASTLQPAHATCVDFMPFDTMVDHVRRARVLVSHAGAGSVLVGLANGKRPIVVPRLSRFGEAVDDHQLEFARRLGASNLVTLVEDPAQLAEVIARDSTSPAAPFGEASRLVEDLRAYLLSRTGTPGLELLRLEPR